MEKTSAFLNLMAGIGIIILDNTSSSCSFSLIGFISLCTILNWDVVTLHDLCSWLLCLLQTTLHSLLTTWMCWAKPQKAHNTVPASTTTPAKSFKDVENLGEKLLRGEVEVVMEKLGIFCDPNGDELRERIGSDDIAELFGEEEEEEVVGLEVAREAFGVFDENCDGFIDASELERVVCSLGLKGFSREECGRMIAAFDENKDGRIDFSEFVKLLENSS